MNILKQIFWLCIQWADVAKAKNMKIYDFSHLDLSHFKLFLPAGRQVWLNPLLLHYHQY